MEPPNPYCGYCVHYRGPDEETGAQVCAAYPDGIPSEILSTVVDHREAYEGDGGIRFELRPSAIATIPRTIFGPDRPDAFAEV